MRHFHHSNLISLTILVVFGMTLGGSLLAQGQTSQPASQAEKQLPDAPTSNSTPAQEAQKPGTNLAKDGGSKTRILGLAPQFGAVDSSITQPLTPNQKFHLFLRSNTDPFIFVAMGITSGISQAENSHKGYGQGAAGYGKRYGAGLADEVDGAFWGNFVLPSLLKEDPRYFRKGEGSITNRAFYAFMTSFIVRTDSGHRDFNYSNVIGNFISGGISNAYYPKDERGFGLTMSNAAIVTLLGGLGSEGEEFWPDVDCHVIHRKRCREQKEADALSAVKANVAPKANATPVKTDQSTSGK